MKFNEIIFTILLLSPLVAHSTPPKISPPVDKIDSVTKDVIVPDVGVITTAEVGESIYSQFSRTVTISQIASIKNNVNTELDRGYKLRLNAGQSSVLKMRTHTKESMICFPTKWSGVVGFFGDKNVVGCLVDKSGSGFFDSTTFPNYDVYFPLESPVEYTVEAEKVISDNLKSFRFEILYQGVSKGEVKISYREYINNMARPSFNQDVSYELNAAGIGTIGFKGMRMRVLKADSQSIEYVIDRPIPVFEVPAQPAAKAAWWQ